MENPEREVPALKMNRTELKNHNSSNLKSYSEIQNLKLSYSCFVGKREYHKVDIPFPFL